MESQVTTVHNSSALASSDVTVRLAGAHDIPSISDIACECRLRVGADISEGFLLQDHGRSQYLRWLQAGAYMLVCETAGETVGFLFALPFAGTSEARALKMDETNAVIVGQVGISPRYRRRGLGRLLYQALFFHFPGRATAATVITAPVENTASIAFHEALGFHAICDFNVGAVDERLFMRSQSSDS
jgi:ribosomal protein S18 acetylase RimI-like enzyme